MKKYEYPIITEENFEKMYKRLVKRKRVFSKWRGYKEGYTTLRVRSPRTRDEFFEFTKNMFGEGMFLGDYQDRPGIEHSKNATDNPIFKLWKEKSNSWRLIGETAFGNMGTGGWDYGSYDHGFTYREKKRIKNLYSSTLSVDNASSNQT